MRALGGRDRGDLLYLPAVAMPSRSEPGAFPLRLNTYRLMSRPQGSGRNQPWLLEQPAVHVRASWEGWVEIHPEDGGGVRGQGRRPGLGGVGQGPDQTQGQALLRHTPRRRPHPALRRRGAQSQRPHRQRGRPVQGLRPPQHDPGEGLQGLGNGALGDGHRSRSLHGLPGLRHGLQGREQRPRRRGRGGRPGTDHQLDAGAHRGGRGAPRREDAFPARGPACNATIRPAPRSAPSTPPTGTRKASWRRSTRAVSAAASAWPPARTTRNTSTGIATRRTRRDRTRTCRSVPRASSRSAPSATTGSRRPATVRWPSSGTWLPGEYVPACAEACPARAIVFGDLSDPGSEVARLARSPRAFRLQEELGTKPKVIYLAEGEASWLSGPITLTLPSSPPSSEPDRASTGARGRSRASDRCGGPLRTGASSARGSGSPVSISPSPGASMSPTSSSSSGSATPGPSSRPSCGCPRPNGAAPSPGWPR